MEGKEAGRRSERVLTQRFALVLALGAAAVAIQPSKSNAQFEFSPPQTLSQVESAGGPVVVDSHGRATVVWQAITPDHEYRLVQSVRLEADGTPGPVRTLSSVPNYVNFKGCVCPQIAIDPQDRVTAAWQIFDGSNLRIEAVQLGADGTPGLAQTLSGAGQNALDQQLAVDSEGRATVVWWIDDGPIDRVESVRLYPGGTSEPVQILSEPGVSTDVGDVAVDPQGRATVVWTKTDGVGGRAIEAVRLDPDGVRGPARTLSPEGENVGAPTVVVDSLGRATVAWWRFGGIYEVKAVRLDSDGVPGAIQKLSRDGQAALNATLVVDGQNRVTASWPDFGQHVDAVRLDAAGVPGPVQRLSGPNHHASYPELATTPDDGVVAVWTHPGAFKPLEEEEECLDEEFELESDVVQAVLIGSNGVLGPVQSVSPHGEQTAGAWVAVDSQGRPTIVWTTFDGTYFCHDAMTRVQVTRGTPIPDLVPEPPPAGPPTPSEGSAAGPGTLRLGGRALVRDGRARIRGVCVGDDRAACRGTVKLMVRKRSRRAEAGSREKFVKGSSQVVIAWGRYHLAGRSRSTLALRLSPLGRALANGIRRSVRAHARGQGVERRIVSVKALASPSVSQNRLRN